MVLSSEKPEELFEKIKSMTDRTEQKEELLNLYHFKKNEIGLPLIRSKMVITTDMLMH